MGIGFDDYQTMDRTDDAGVPTTGEFLRTELDGIRPVRFAVLGGGLYLALAVGWIASTALRIQFGSYPPFGPGIFGGPTTDPSDLFLTISSTYAGLTQIWPVLAVLLGVVVRRSVSDHRRQSVLASAAVTVGAVVALSLVALAFLATHPEPGSVDFVMVIKPTAVATVGILATCSCSALVVSTFKSLGPS